MYRKGKKLACWLVTLCLLLALLPAAALAADAPAFSDMPEEDYWSFAALTAAVENGLLQGDGGKLLPDDPLTRAQLAAIVNRAYGALDTADIGGFTDVPDDAWYQQDIAKAVRMGTFQGDGSTMRPNDPVTRQEAFTVLARAFRLSDGDSAALAQFSDAEAVADWAKGPVAALVEAGYVNGRDGAICPTEPITRAEFVQVMYKMLALYVREAGTFTEDVEGNVIINVPDVTLKDMEIGGDLIIGEGVGDGDVTLDNVQIKGRMVVRGGGENSIHIINSTNVGSLYICKTGDGGVRVYSAKGCEVEIVEIDDGDDRVILEGSYNQVIVETDTPVELKNAEVSTVTVNAEGASLSVTGSESKIGTITLEATAADTALTVDQGAEVSQVIIKAEKAAVSGDGDVKSVQVKADNADITTGGTAVAVDEGVEGTTAGGKAVDGGESTVTPKNSSGGASAGGYVPATVTGVPDSVIFSSGQTYTGATVSLQVEKDGVTAYRDFTVASTDADVKNALAAGKDTVIPPTVDDNGSTVPTALSGDIGSEEAILVIAPEAIVTMKEETTFTGYVQNSGTFEIFGTAVTLDCARFLNAGRFTSYTGNQSVPQQSLVNKGRLINAPAGSMELCRMTVENSGSLDNVAYDAQMSGMIRIYGASTFTNSGTFVNQSVPANDGRNGVYMARIIVFGGSSFLNASGGVFTNDGSFSMALGTYGGTDFDAKTSQRLTTRTPSSLVNQGVINNNYRFQTGGADVENAAGGVINNAGYFQICDGVAATYNSQLEVTTTQPSGSYFARTDAGWWYIDSQTASDLEILPASFVNNGTINSKGDPNDGSYRINFSAATVTNNGTINSDVQLNIFRIDPAEFLDWFTPAGKTYADTLPERQAAVQGLVVPQISFTNNGTLIANGYTRLDGADFTQGAGAKTELQGYFVMYGGKLTIPAGANFYNGQSMALYDVYGGTGNQLIDASGWPDLASWRADRSRCPGYFTWAVRAESLDSIKAAEAAQAQAVAQGTARHDRLEIRGNITIDEDLTLSAFNLYEYRAEGEDTTLTVTGATLTVAAKNEFRVEGNGNRSYATLAVAPDGAIVIDGGQLRIFHNAAFDNQGTVTNNSVFTVVFYDDGTGAITRYCPVNGAPANVYKNVFVRSDAGLLNALEGDYNSVSLVNGTVARLTRTPTVSASVEWIGGDAGCGMIIEPGVTLALNNAVLSTRPGVSLGVAGTVLLGDGAHIYNNGSLQVGASSGSERGEIIVAGQNATIFNGGSIHVYKTGAITLGDGWFDNGGGTVVNDAIPTATLYVKPENGSFTAYDAATGAAVPVTLAAGAAVPAQIGFYSYTVDANGDYTLSFLDSRIYSGIQTERLYQGRDGGVIKAGKYNGGAYEVEMDATYAVLADTRPAGTWSNLDQLDAGAQAALAINERVTLDILIDPNQNKLIAIFIQKVSI